MALSTALLATQRRDDSEFDCMAHSQSCESLTPLCAMTTDDLKAIQVFCHAMINYGAKKGIIIANFGGGPANFGATDETWETTGKKKHAKLEALLEPFRKCWQISEKLLVALTSEKLLEWRSIHKEGTIRHGPIG